MEGSTYLLDCVRELGPETNPREIEQLAKLSGFSARRIYQVRRQLFPSSRRPRSDWRKLRLSISPEVLEFMFALTRQARLDARNVILVTARHWSVPENFISISTYNRLLREAGISLDDLSHDRNAFREHRWRGRANELFLCDATVAGPYYPNPDGSIGYEPQWARYKNKLGNKRPRVILWAGVDYASGVIFARFCFSETTQTLLDFLFWAWSEKVNPRFPAFGIPNNFYGDEGPCFKSGVFVRAYEGGLGGHRVRSDPSHWTDFGARRHGGVEVTFGPGLLGGFMKLTKVASFKSLDEMNDALEGFLIRLNNRPVRGETESRFCKWLRTVGTPRSMPSEEMRQLLRYEVAQRAVGLNMRIQLNGKVFELPNESKYAAWVGKVVTCYWYRGAESKANFVYEFDETPELTAIKRDDDEVFTHPYEAAAKTGREDFLKRLDHIDLSTINIRDAYDPAGQVPYVRRAGAAFDNTKLSEKRVATATGSRPALSPEKLLTRKAAITELQRRDFFRVPPSVGDFAWLDALLNGRPEIGETELIVAMNEAEEKMSAEASGESR
jgi:hypothetical protein